MDVPPTQRIQNFLKVLGLYLFNIRHRCITEWNAKVGNQVFMAHNRLGRWETSKSVWAQAAVHVMQRQRWERSDDF